MPRKTPDPTKAVLRFVKDALKNINSRIEANNCHAQELREAESKRIDANRAGDLKAIEVKAAQDQTTLRDLSSRVSALELAQSQNTGRSGISTQLIIALAVVFGGLLVYIVEAVINRK